MFLIIHLNQQKVVTSITSPMSKIFQFLSSLMYVDDTDLYVFNDGSMRVLKVVINAQQLLNA